MSVLRCPICDKRFDSETSAALPFCGPRCRQVDLGRWLGEQYAVPESRREDEDDEQFEEPPQQD